MTDNVFTPEEVFNLNEFQKGGRFHPFTCSNRTDGKHILVNGDIGVLIPTVRGWICQFCNYTQNWAHEGMKAKSDDHV